MDEGCPNIIVDAGLIPHYPVKGYYDKQTGCGSHYTVYFLETTCHHRCSYKGYEVLKKGIFTKESGYEPDAMLVKCRKCGFEHYLFPKINTRGIKLELA